jgi:hypothetical protein
MQRRYSQTCVKKTLVLPGIENRPFRPRGLRRTKGGDLGVEPDWLFAKGWFFERRKKRMSFCSDLAKLKPRSAQWKPQMSEMRRT